MGFDCPYQFASIAVLPRAITDHRSESAQNPFTCQTPSKVNALASLVESVAGQPCLPQIPNVSVGRSQTHVLVSSITLAPVLF